MESRKLGTNGPHVSVIGFGAWPIGGAMGNVTEEQAIEAVRAAVDSGQTFLDTAESYYVSQERVGKALAKGDYRERTFLATKVSGNYTREHIEQAIDNNLRALQTDHLDLFQIHHHDTPPPIEKQMEVMLKLQEQGKTRFVGVSNYTLEHLEAAWKAGPFQTNQPCYNMFDRTIEKEILPWCSEHGVSTLVHSPLGKGLLSGRYYPGYEFPKDDERSTFARFHGKIFASTCAKAEKLKAIAERKGLTLPQLAIGWTLRLPDIVVCLVGAKTKGQVLQNNGGQGWTLTKEELEEIEGILDGGS
jgi:aryl-alcohol dehydrogenase-like predicted oxidoreductase